MMTPKRLLPALALFVLPSIGCVGAAPVDEPAPAPAAAAPANAANPTQGFPHAGGTVDHSVVDTGDGADSNMLGGCIPGHTGDGIGGDDGIPCPPPQKPPVQEI